MKICAVICEYNPLHNGHEYQLSEIRKKSNCDGIICVMSGDFVQRAEPAVINKLARTECALRSGADMVVQLPTVYATGNGELFAKGAIDIISKLPDVKYLAMGCETDNTNALSILAEIQLNEPAKLKRILNANLKRGLSYAESYADATAKIAEKYNIGYDMSDVILSTPNNILCMEYIKALKRIGSNIEPVFIKRNNEASVSSSEIRKNIFSNNTDSYVKKYVPPHSYKRIHEENTIHPIDFRTYSDIMTYTMKNMSSNTIAKTVDSAEGIEHRISAACNNTTNYNTLLECVKTKRYTLSRIKRICLQCAFGINYDTISHITHTFAQVLGIKNYFKKYLSSLPSCFSIKAPIFEEYSNDIQSLLNIEKAAHNLYTLLTHNDTYKLHNRLISI